jgi:cellulose synthase/poly-beta-1,6-N-acetylglucosamine synthase-like glycosyltransferase
MTAAASLLVLILLLALVAPVCLYCLLLTGVAPFGLRRRPPAARVLRRFAVLVPAHNEEAVLGRLLDSLAALDYPPELVRVCVVADNCTDGTAAVARAQGALVVERRDPERSGKGYALAWLLAELERMGQRFDAYVIVDADSVLSANFLHAMNRRLEAGARAVQAYYTVLPVRGTAAERLREAALALVHYLRPAGKAALGLSCGLKGNGMCFDRSVVERFGWPVAGLAEDVEMHLLLVAAGVRVAFAPEAVVWAEMPPTLGGARGQNLRWEAGRLTALRRQALPLLRRALVRRDLVALDAALEQLVPPLSVPVLLSGLGLVAGVLLRAPVVAGTAAAIVALLALHVLAGLALARAPGRAYRALAMAPLYMGWKAWIYGRALVGRVERRWVRTARVERGIQG